MEKVDIEALLKLAYAQYRVDRLTPEMMLGMERPLPPNASPTAGLAQFLALGTRVDTSRRAASLFGERSAKLGTPIDLLTLDEAVMALPDTYVEWVHQDEVAIWTADLVREAGARLENDGRVWLLHRPGLEPARVENIVTSVLMIGHARDGNRPDWCPEGVGVQPVRNAHNGKPMLIDAAYGRACLVDYYPTPEMLMARRARYVVWRRAMADLVAALNGETEQFEATGPLASPAPWNDSQRVIHMSRMVGTRRA